MILKKILNLIKYPYLNFKLLHKIILDKFFKNHFEKKSKKFFSKNNQLLYFKLGVDNELKPEFIDLKNLYDLIIERKPRCVLEFGSGFSTIAIALALKKNNEIKNIEGKLFTVDGNKKWIENTKNKLHKDLSNYVKFYYSQPYISKFRDQLVTYHETLPDISPNFIYLDGPAPNDVVNDINGLSFNSKVIEKNNGQKFFEKNTRRIIAADILLYESTSPSDFFILVDRRYSNANFLEKNLIFNYDIKKKLYFGGNITFEKKYQPYP